MEFTPVELAIDGIADEFQECISLCLQCHKTCEQLIPYCVSKGGGNVEFQHLKTLAVCAEVCRSAAHMMMWNSDLRFEICRLCTKACSRCADNCERFSSDEMMQLCAGICRDCAEVCYEMSTR